MKKPTETKNEKQEILEAAHLLVSNKKYKQAKLILAETSEKEFMKSLNSYNINENTFNFIKTFEKPDWYSYIEKTGDYEIHNLIKNFKKENIDLSSVEKHGKSIVSFILEKFKTNDGNYNNYTKKILPLLKDLNPELLVKEFMKNSNDLFSLGSSEEMMDKANYLIKILNTPEIKASPSYSELFSKNSIFINHLFNKKIDDISNFLEINKDFISKDKSEHLISTKVLKNIFSSNALSPEIKSSFETLIKEKRFNPNIDLLDDDFKNAVLKGNITLERIDILKTLISEKILNVNSMNTVQENSPTAYQRLLQKSIYDINNSNGRKDRIEKSEKLLKNLNDVESVGLKPYFSSNTKEYLLESVKHAFKPSNSYRRGDVSDEIFQISHDLRMPPFVIEKLVDFFDKRYGNIKDPALKNLEEIKQEEIKEKIITLINVMVEAPKEDLQKKIKP